MQEWTFEANGYRHQTETGTNCTMARGSCHECWRIPATDTYVHIKLNELAYKEKYCQSPCSDKETL